MVSVNFFQITIQLLKAKDMVRDQLYFSYIHLITSAIYYQT